MLSKKELYTRNGKVAKEKDKAIKVLSEKLAEMTPRNESMDILDVR